MWYVMYDLLTYAQLIFMPILQPMLYTYGCGEYNEMVYYIMNTHTHARAHMSNAQKE